MRLYYGLVIERTGMPSHLIPVDKYAQILRFPELDSIEEATERFLSGDPVSPTSDIRLREYPLVAEFMLGPDVVLKVFRDMAPGESRPPRSLITSRRSVRQQTSTMTEEQYAVYTRHGGHKKKHPLDEAQGL